MTETGKAMDDQGLAYRLKNETINCNSDFDDSIEAIRSLRYPSLTLRLVRVPCPKQVYVEDRLDKPLASRLSLRSFSRVRLPFGGNPDRRGDLHSRRNLHRTEAQARPTRTTDWSDSIQSANPVRILTILYHLPLAVNRDIVRSDGRSCLSQIQP